jgi:hypothetical protein
VLRRSVGHAFSSLSDDEVGELQGAIRADAMFAPPICRRSPTKRVKVEKICGTVLSSDSTKTAAL